jgi:NAD(P)H-dependent FMN reductase
MYNPDDHEPTETAATLIESCQAADGLLWSSPLYQGTISGALKNALDWLHVLGDRDPPYLHDKVIGLISAAGGTQGAASDQHDGIRGPGAPRMGGALRGSGRGGVPSL